MNCDSVRAKIDEFVYDKSTRPTDEVISHIADCPSCHQYLKNCRSAKKITDFLRQVQPEIKDSQKFTDDMLTAIDELEPEIVDQRVLVLHYLKRFLVAASVGLVLIFGYEQYVVVNKQIDLEVNMSVATGVNYGSNSYKTVLTYYPDRTMELVKSELASKFIDSKKMNMKSLIMFASYSVLSKDEIMKQIQNQTLTSKNSNTKNSPAN